MKILKTLKRIFLIIIFLLILIPAYKIYEAYGIYCDVIEAKPIDTMINEIKQKENYTTLVEMPEIYKKAVVAVEDKRFYSHKGIDIVAITRAVINDIRYMSFVEGGSTITQQLAKNTYFTQEKTITRKIAEVFVAFDFEEKCNKDEILELYLNTSYFGEGCYSVKTASRFYFDKEPIDMTFSESTMLAGIPNAPSVYAPTKNPDLAKQRQRQVLSKMVECGIISNDEALEIIEDKK